MCRQLYFCEWKQVSPYAEMHFPYKIHFVGNVPGVQPLWQVEVILSSLLQLQLSLSSAHLLFNKLWLALNSALTWPAAQPHVTGSGCTSLDVSSEGIKAWKTPKRLNTFCTSSHPWDQPIFLSVSHWQCSYLNRDSLPSQTRMSPLQRDYQLNFAASGSFISIIKTCSSVANFFSCFTANSNRTVSSSI